MPKREREEALGEPLTKAAKKAAKVAAKAAAKEAKRAEKKAKKQEAKAAAKAQKKAERDAAKAAKTAAKAARRAAKGVSGSGGEGFDGGRGADEWSGGGDLMKDRTANDLGAKPKLDKPKWGDENKATTGEVKNVTGTCRVCFSNLSFQIDEEKLAEALKDKCGAVSNVDWLLEAGTGKFYGKAVVDFATPEAATAGVLMGGTKIMGRPCRAEFAKPKKDNARDGGKAKKTKLGKKPEGCVTLFLGNMDFQVNREGLESFFEDCGAIKDVRWVKDKVTNEFKGCAFVEFWETGAVDKAIQKSSEELLGRKMRMSYQA